MGPFGELKFRYIQKLKSQANIELQAGVATMRQKTYYQLKSRNTGVQLRRYAHFIYIISSSLLTDVGETVMFHITFISPFP